MAIRSETIGLQNPKTHALPQVRDQWSFLFLDHARIVQDDTGVTALLTRQEGGRVPIPVAAISTLLLGPGCSISHAALTTITKHGTTIAWVGDEGTRTHGWAYSLTTSAAWAEAQATLWADPARRRQVAVEMYRHRFGDLPAGPVITLQRLRGLEGQRMKKAYALYARRYGIHFKRQYDPDNFDGADPVNKALTSANAALYGVALAAITAVGCHPALGFVHAGSINAFVFDVADLYKADIAIPAAFAAAGHTEPAAQARRNVRDAIVRNQLLSRTVSDIQRLLRPGLEDASPSELLLRDETGFVEGGRNYSDEAVDIFLDDLEDGALRPEDSSSFDDEYHGLDDPAPWAEKED